MLITTIYQIDLLRVYPSKVPRWESMTCYICDTEIKILFSCFALKNWNEGSKDIPCLFLVELLLWRKGTIGLYYYNNKFICQNIKKGRGVKDLSYDLKVLQVLRKTPWLNFIFFNSILIKIIKESKKQIS